MGIRGLGLGMAASALALALAGCGPTVPDSGAGAGFEDYSNYSLRQAQRDAEVAARQAPGPVISDEELARRRHSGAGWAALPAAGGGGSGAAAGRRGGRAAPRPRRAVSVGISDEQDFQAVSARESIDPHGPRLAERKAAYQEVAPEALPDRAGAQRHAGDRLRAEDHECGRPEALSRARRTRRTASTAPAPNIRARTWRRRIS